MVLKYSRTYNQIFGETVFGGNNFVFCMCKRNRCFAGDKPGKLLMSFFLINIPGLVFDIMIAPSYNSPIYLGIGVFL